MLVYPDDRKPKFHDTLSENSTYFVKNTVKKTIPGIENLFEATDDTVITHLKRSFKTDQRYTFRSEWSAFADLMCYSGTICSLFLGFFIFLFFAAHFSPRKDCHNILKFCTEF